MTTSEEWQRIKADPELYAKYIEGQRKHREKIQSDSEEYKKEKEYYRKKTRERYARIKSNPTLYREYLDAHRINYKIWYTRQVENLKQTDPEKYQRILKHKKLVEERKLYKDVCLDMVHYARYIKKHQKCKKKSNTRIKRFRYPHKTLGMNKISINTILQLGITQDELEATEYLKRAVRYTQKERKHVILGEKTIDRAFGELVGLVKDENSVFKDVEFLMEYFSVEEEEVDR